MSFYLVTGESLCQVCWSARLPSPFPLCPTLIKWGVRRWYQGAGSPVRATGSSSHCSKIAKDRLWSGELPCTVCLLCAWLALCGAFSCTIAVTARSSLANKQALWGCLGSHHWEVAEPGLGPDGLAVGPKFWTLPSPDSPPPLSRSLFSYSSLAVATCTSSDIYDLWMASIGTVWSGMICDTLCSWTTKRCCLRFLKAFVPGS